MQNFGMESSCFRNGNSSVKTASGSYMHTHIYAQAGAGKKERVQVCEIEHITTTTLEGVDRTSVFSFPGGGVSSHLTVKVDKDTKCIQYRHDRVVCEAGWVLKNLELFKNVYSTCEDPMKLPGWFNDMFLEIMDRLMYDCQCDELPEMLMSVRDYVSGLDRPVGKED